MIQPPTHAQHIEALEETIRALKTERALFIQERMEDHARHNEAANKAVAQWDMRVHALERENRRLTRDLDDQDRRKARMSEQDFEISRLKSEVARAAAAHVGHVTLVNNLRTEVARLEHLATHERKEAERWYKKHLQDRKELNEVKRVLKKAEAAVKSQPVYKFDRSVAPFRSLAMF